MNMKIEIWNCCEIRFIERTPGDWWAVAKDVAVVLDYSDSAQMTRRLDSEDIDTLNWKAKQTAFNADCFMDYKYRSKIPIISETGLYDAIFGSGKAEAKDFKKWVKNLLKTLREATGLEGFQVFRMMDKEHQKDMMGFIYSNLPNPKQTDFIKANTVANKAISNKHGYSKMIKKDDMTPQMLQERQPILEDTVQLIVLKDKFGIDVSVSDVIYGKYGKRA